jgi:hypothetical protein
MTKTLTAMTAATALVAALAFAPADAYARPRGGAIAAGIIGGLAAGAILGGAIANSRAYYGGYAPVAGYAPYPAYARAVTGRAGRSTIHMANSSAIRARGSSAHNRGAVLPLIDCVAGRHDRLFPCFGQFRAERDRIWASTAAVGQQSSVSLFAFW